MLIGISGKMSTGKTTLADRLEDIWPAMRIHRTAFAGPLKEEAASAYNFPLEYCYSQRGKDQIIFHPDLPSQSMTVRQILQWHGQKRREQDPHYWVKAVYLDLCTLTDRDMIIIDDVRYPNEAKMIRELGGLTVRLNPYPSWAPGPYADHISEIALDSHRFDLEYTPDFGDLERVAIEIAHALEVDAAMAEGCE
jgi:hypothetical protein